MSRVIAVSFGLGLVAGMAPAANPIAEILCEPTERLHDRLSGRMQGTRQATGLRGPDQVIEVWTDPQGSWTLVMTYASGTSCIVAMGDHWTPSVIPDPA